jgi:hypothetical protein
MAYQIITSTDVEELETKVSHLMSIGWEPIGSHKVITYKTTNRGELTYYANEYSQTMTFVKKDVLHLKDEVVNLLNILKEDAEMALSGEWDCTTDEGIESFNDQITLIEKTLDKLK